MNGAYVITGGNPLNGRCKISGAKNSALKLMATSLLAPGRSILDNAPSLADTGLMIEVLSHLGATVAWTTDGRMTIDVPQEIGHVAPYEPVRKMRASTAVLGPLVARTKKARVSLPGGCSLGRRGLDLHIKGLEALGVRVNVVHGFLEASATELVGAAIHLDYPSHGATETILMAASLADGTTVITNASKEPEIVDLAECLRSMGAKVEGDGTNEITIVGVEQLQPYDHRVIPDRLEAGTYLFATLATTGDVTLEDCDPTHLEVVIEELTSCGADLTVGIDSLRIVANAPPKPIDISTLPYPGFPTDLQPIAVAALSVAAGRSIVTENIFDGRFMVLDELTRMGAKLRCENHYVVIDGVRELSGARVCAPDIRAGAGLVVAGLVAQGTTVVENLELIDRGYERLEEKLSLLGGSISRTSDAEGVEVDKPTSLIS